MVLIAVLVNSVLIGMGDLVDRMVPGLSDTFTILLVVIVEVRCSQNAVRQPVYSCSCIVASKHSEWVGAVWQHVMPAYHFISKSNRFVLILFLFHC